MLQWQRTSDNDESFYPKPLGSGGGVAKHLELHISVLVLVRQELVLKFWHETSLSSYKFTQHKVTWIWLVQKISVLLNPHTIKRLNSLVLIILVSGMTWTSSGNLGAPNPLGMSGFASSGLIFTQSRYHSIASMSENTSVMDDDFGNDYHAWQSWSSRILEDGDDVDHQHLNHYSQLGVVAFWGS